MGTRRGGVAGGGGGMEVVKEVGIRIKMKRDFWLVKCARGVQYERCVLPHSFTIHYSLLPVQYTLG